eukprot:202258_1
MTYYDWIGQELQQQIYGGLRLIILSHQPGHFTYLPLVPLVNQCYRLLDLTTMTDGREQKKCVRRITEGLRLVDVVRKELKKKPGDIPGESSNIDICLYIGYSY